MDPIVGTQIGPYKVGRPVGQGGIGSVYEATHQQIGRRVAIKILRAEHARDRDTVARLFNEARAVNRVEHPGLVQIFDCDQLPDGRAYLVMEFLQGETLTQRLASGGGRLTPGAALRIAYQLASILAATHAATIVHRDLKPGNIMLVRDPDVPGGERVKLLDFGIAKLAPAGEDGLTRPGMVFGTPTYMSPEQCRGAAEVDGRSDVYSLAVILFQMMAGKPPFPGEGVGVVALHLCEDPPPLASVVPQIDAGVAALVATMLAKKREDRPTMEQVATTLRDHAAAASAGGSASHPALQAGQVPRGTSSQPALQAGQIPRGTGSQPSLQLSGDLAALSHPSTLGRIVGQQVEEPQRKGSALSLALGALLLLGSGGLTAWLLRPPRPSPIKRPPAPVRWSITTQPSGATISRIEDGQILGRTPWTQEQPTTPGEQKVRVTLPDHRSRDVTLDRSHNESLDLLLEHDAPAPRTSESEAKPPGRAKSAGSKSGKAGKGKTPAADAPTRIQVVDD